MKEVLINDAKAMYELALGKRDSMIGETLNGEKVLITPTEIYVPGLRKLFMESQEEDDLVYGDHI